MVHLSIEPLVQKFHISHWYKEAMVDYIFNIACPRLAFRQKIPEEAQVLINDLFKSYGKDLEKIC